MSNDLNAASGVSTVADVEPKQPTCECGGGDGMCGDCAYALGLVEPEQPTHDAAMKLQSHPAYDEGWHHGSLAGIERERARIRQDVTAAFDAVGWGAHIGLRERVLAAIDGGNDA